MMLEARRGARAVAGVRFDSCSGAPTLPHRAAPTVSRSAVCAAILLALAAPGCRSGGQSKKWIWTQARAEAVLLEALEAESPDDRRRAIERISRSKYASSDDSVKTLGLIVRTDTSQIVRRTAAHGLGGSQREEACAPLLKVLDAENLPREVRAADAALRQTCVTSLDTLISASVCCGPAQPMIAVVVGLLRNDRDREVRIAAARLLRHFRHIDALDGLIAAQRQHEFAVTYEAEQSLIQLTGHTHGQRHDDWRVWLGETEDPFAHAGRTPPGLAARGEKRPWWRLFGK